MLTPTSSHGRSARRRLGFTMAELLLVLLLFSLVGAAMMRIILRQQRFYRGAADIMAMRTNMREVGTAVPSDLRGISSIGGDIYAMSDSAIDFRLPTGLTTVCSIGVGRTTMVIPPSSLKSRSGLTSWLTAPLSGDTLFVYDEGATSLMSDDSWQEVALSAAPTAGVCPPSTGFTADSVEGTLGTTLTLGSALNPGVVVGSTVRFFRHARYKLYQPNGSAWYLGYAECPVGGCAALQAVAGPFLPYSANGALTGLRLVYRDTTGAVTTTPANVARIDLTVRAQTQRPIQMPGRPNDYYRDSVVVTVALRNRS